MEISSTVVATAVGLLLGPILTYIIASRRLSGKIATSDAVQLWEEARAIRIEYRQEIQHLRDSEEECKGEVRALREQVRQLKEELNDLKFPS